MDGEFDLLQWRRKFLKAAGLAVTATLGNGGFSPFFNQRGAWAAESPNAGAGESSLQERAARKGLFFGAAVVAAPLNSDTRLGQAIARDCGMVVPDSALKWNWVQGGAEKTKPDYSVAESIYAFARSKGLKMRGHALVWHNSIPPWVTREVTEARSASVVGDLLVTHVTEVANAWKGRLVHWDVVNEPLSAGKGYIWQERLGEQYIDLAFNAAKAADPSALLVLNQDLVELAHPYQRKLRSRFLDLLERLLKRGVPIDAVGIEGHLYGELMFNASEYDEFLRSIEGMGLKLIVTELDVWDGKISGSVADRDRISASLVKQFLDVSLSHRNCLGVLTWTLTDLYAWYHTAPKKWRTDGQPNRAGLLDVNYQRKPMWNAVASAFDSAVVR